MATSSSHWGHLLGLVDRRTLLFSILIVESYFVASHHGSQSRRHVIADLACGSWWSLLVGFGHSLRLVDGVTMVLGVEG